MHNFELNKYCDFVNYQTQHRAIFVHQPAKVTKMISIMEHFWIDTISVTKCSRKVSSSQYNRVFLSAQPILAGSLVGTHTQIVGSNRLAIRGGRVPESFHRSHCSVVAFLSHSLAKPSGD